MHSIVRRFIFFGVFSLFLYIAGLVVYEALAVIFVILDQRLLLLLGTLLVVFTGSFVVSTLLGMRAYNVFTRVYYLLASTWIGFFTYLFLAMVAYGLVVMFTGKTENGTGMLLVLAAFLLSVYGLLNARRIHVTEVTVPLPNLSQRWEGRKAIWISDVHLGQLLGPSFAHEVAKKINGLPHDIIFIGGDLFDGTGAPDILELTEAFNTFSAPLGTYFITGNHEEYGDSNRFTEALRTHGIRVLTDELIDIDGMQLIGADYSNALDRERFREMLGKLVIDRERPSILLKHEPKNLDVANDSGVSLQISGHTHKGQMWPFGYIADLIYKGYAYGLGRFEDMYVFTSSGTGTWGPPMRVGTKSEIVLFTFV